MESIPGNAMGHDGLGIKRRSVGGRDILRSLFVEVKERSDSSVDSCVDPMVKLITGGNGRPLSVAAKLDLRR